MLGQWLERKAFARTARNPVSVAVLLLESSAIRYYTHWRVIAQLHLEDQWLLYQTSMTDAWISSLWYQISAHQRARDDQVCSDSKARGTIVSLFIARLRLSAEASRECLADGPLRLTLW